MPFDNYYIRTYKEGDEIKLIELFTKNYSQYVFPARTKEYWLWCNKKRPDVKPNGIFIVENNEKIIGYAVVSDTGNVYEFAIDKNSNFTKITSLLFSKIEAYAKSKGAEAITVYVPSDSKKFKKVFFELGYENDGHVNFAMIVLNMPNLIRKLLSSSEIPKGWNENFFFDLKQKGYPLVSSFQFCLKIKNEKIYVKEGKPKESCIHITTNTTSFIELLLEPEKIFQAIFQKKLKITPSYKFYKIIKLISLLRLPKIYISYADIR